MSAKRQDMTPEEELRYLQTKYAFLHPKSKAVCILLGIFFGGLGMHNFYLGYVGRGILELIISFCMFPLFFLFLGAMTREPLAGIGLVIVILWPFALMGEALLASKDSLGVPLR